MTCWLKEAGAPPEQYEHWRTAENTFKVLINLSSLFFYRYPAYRDHFRDVTKMIVNIRTSIFTQPLMSPQGLLKGTLRSGMP
jgi:hypothetical protein